MTYQPELYDLATPASVQGDVDWYLRQAQESQGPVLELGAGTGRITLPIAAGGIDITALDASQPMLDLLRTKLDATTRARVSVVQGDMRTFTLPTQFPLVIIPFRAFLHNTTEADQLACLERVRQHLTPDGRLALNFFHPSLEYMAQHAGALAGVWRWTGTHQRPDSGFVVLSEATRYDTIRRLVHALHRYDEYDASGRLTGSSVLRLELAYLFPADIRSLLARAGFANVEIAGGFDGCPFSHDGDELVITASAEAKQAV